MSDPSAAMYDAAFYADQAQESLASALAVLPRIFALHRPACVVDIGCGVGPWLAAAGRLGATDLLGIDGDYVAREALLVPPDRFLPWDLAQPGLAEAALAGRDGHAFDLAICVEVAEHLPFDAAGRFIAELCRLSDVVLFSAAIPFQHGTGHINEQWPEFWAMHFRAQGFLCFDALRDAIWADPQVRWWYAQNLLVFVREGSPAAADFATIAPATGCLARVHPEAWLSTILNLWRPYRVAARNEEPADLRTMLDAWLAGTTPPPEPSAVARARRAPPGAHDIFPFTRTEVADVEAWIGERDSALREALAAERRTAAAAATQTSAFEMRLKEAAEQAESLRTALQATEQELSATRTSPARMTELEARLQAAAAEHRGLEEALHKAIAARDRLEKHLAMAQSANRVLQAQMAQQALAQTTTREVAADVATLRADLAARSADAAAWQQQAEQHRTLVEALLASRSWRITAPLRRVASALRK